MRLLWRRTKSNFFTLLRCNMMGGGRPGQHFSHSGMILVASQSAISPYVRLFNFT
jgi:hypothetical protein